MSTRDLLANPTCSRSADAAPSATTNTSKVDSAWLAPSPWTTRALPAWLSSVWTGQPNENATPARRQASNSTPPNAARVTARAPSPA
ncbi:hypothetical protein G6F31_019182 [Rhizopus arrhizus]|nr:hypothetical protein G6F31_019182 [Rhizopus arrhizus]